MNREELIAARGEAAKDIKSIDVKGKQYVMVNERIKAFRAVYPEGVIKTTLLEDDGERVTFKASVYSDKDTLLATAHAYELKSSSYINKTSYIENCETSAVGRALGFCGIGCDDSIASAEEVRNAIEAQEELKAQKVEKSAITANQQMAFRKWLVENDITETALVNALGKQVKDITVGEMKWFVNNPKEAKERCGV